MFSDYLFPLGLMTDSLDVLCGQSFDVSPLDGELVSSSGRVERETSCKICRVIFTAAIEQEILPFILTISEDTTDKSLDLFGCPGLNLCRFLADFTNLQEFSVPFFFTQGYLIVDLF